MDTSQQPHIGPVISGSGNAAGQITRQALLDTAEDLFARYGIDGVSLRHISVAAGQRNPGTVKYHFGTKHDLIQALIEDRANPVDERRLLDFETLGINEKPAEIQSLVEAGIRPLVDALGVRSNHYRFLAQLYQSPARLQLSLEAGAFGRSAEVLRERGEIFLAHLPQLVREQRHRLALHVIISGLADVADLDALTNAQSRELVNDLIVTVAAIYEAP